MEIVLREVGVCGGRGGEQCSVFHIWSWMEVVLHKVGGWGGGGCNLPYLVIDGDSTTSGGWMEEGCSLPDLVMDGCSVSVGEDGLTGYWVVQCAHQGVREHCDEVTGGGRGGV